MLFPVLIPKDGNQLIGSSFLYAKQPAPLTLTDKARPKLSQGQVPGN